MKCIKTPSHTCIYKHICIYRYIYLHKYAWFIRCVIDGSANFAPTALQLCLHPSKSFFLEIICRLEHCLFICYALCQTHLQRSTISVELFFHRWTFHTIQTRKLMTSSNGNIFCVTGPFVRGMHRSPVNSPHKGQLRGALMFSLTCAWNNGWANNRETGDLRRHCAQYDVTVMKANLLGIYPISKCTIAWNKSELNSYCRKTAVYHSWR